MAYSLVTSISARSTNTNGFTTGSADTTGANLLLLAVGSHSSGPTVTVSDSKSNTWTGLTEYQPGGGGSEIKIFHCLSPSVGSGHTFTATGNASFSALAMFAFSNSGASAFDKESGLGDDGTLTDIEPGSVTPAADNALLVSALVVAAPLSAIGIGSSFTLQEAEDYTPGESMGVAFAYKIQTSAGAENPTWTWGGNGTNLAASIAVFNLAGGGGGGIIQQAMHYYQHLNG